jgi:hypothetical protein
MGVCGLALLIILFAVPWYGLTSVFAPTAITLGAKANSNGFDSLPVASILVIVTGLLAVSAWLFQALCRAPALPVAATALTEVFGFVTFLALIYRVLISLPENNIYVEAKFGAYAGLVLSAAVWIGGYVSLREDGLAEDDAPKNIETLRLTPRPTAPAR